MPDIPFRDSPDRLGPWTPRPAEGYGHIRTLAEKAGIGPGIYRLWQRNYARDYGRFGVFVSERDEFPGYRRVVVLDPGWVTSNADTHPFVILTVDEDGRAGCRLFEGGGDGRPPILDLLAASVPDLSPAAVARDFQLNRFTAAYRQAPINAAQEFFQSAFRVPEPDSGESAEIPAAFYNPTMALIRRSTVSNYRLASYALRAALDPEILRVMQSTQNTTMGWAFWLSGRPSERDPTDVPEGVRSRNRLQAARAYPLLMPVMQAQRPSGIIDEGRPLAGLLAEQLYLAPSELKGLRGLTWQKAGLRPHPDTHEVQALARLATQGRADKRRDLKKTNAFIRLAHAASLSTEDVIGKLFSNGRTASDLSDKQLSGLRDATDMLRDLDRRLLRPAAIVGAHAFRGVIPRATGPEDDVETIHAPSHGTGYFDTQMVASLFMAMPVKDLLEGSARWHRSVGRHSENVLTLVSDIEWDGLVGRVDLPGGVTGREISSTRGLTLQGQMEGHCVGGYDETVLSSTPENVNLIFSLEVEGEIVGTLHARGTVSDKTSRMAFMSEQLRGHANEDPGPVAVAAASALLLKLDALGPEVVSSYVTRMSGAVEARRNAVRLTPSLQEAGYNYWDRGEMETAWAEYAPYLPRAVRKAGLDALIASMAEHGGKTPHFALDSPIGTPDANGIYHVPWQGGTVRKIRVRSLEETETALAAAFREEGPAIRIDSLQSIAYQSKYFQPKPLGVAPKGGTAHDTDHNCEEMPF